MLWIIVSLVIAVIDQISKHYILQNLEMGHPITVINNFFYITPYRNSGGAWGFLQNGRVLFLIIIPLISAVVIYFMIKSRRKFLQFALSMILGGAIGNYIDRLFAGGVTDFLQFYIGSYAFPIFNAADMAITGGTILLAIYMIFIYKDPSRDRTKEKETLEIHEKPDRLEP